MRFRLTVLEGLTCVVLIALIGEVFAADPASETSVLVNETFDAPLGKGWNITTGKWVAENGVLKASEISDDKHAAAARRIITTGDATYRLRFRFTKEGKAFHFGFDPAKGELKKKGHLFSVVVMPERFQILKHVDKARPKEDPNEVLAVSREPVSVGQWHQLVVSTVGTKVVATLDETKLEAEHATFAVKKPTLVFRCVGDGVELDDVNVTASN